MPASRNPQPSGSAPPAASELRAAGGRIFSELSDFGGFTGDLLVNRAPAPASCAPISDSKSATFVQKSDTFRQFPTGGSRGAGRSGDGVVAGHGDRVGGGIATAQWANVALLSPALPRRRGSRPDARFARRPLCPFGRQTPRPFGAAPHTCGGAGARFLPAQEWRVALSPALPRLRGREGGYALRARPSLPLRGISPSGGEQEPPPPSSGGGRPDARFARRPLCLEGAPETPSRR